MTETFMIIGSGFGIVCGVILVIAAVLASICAVFVAVTIIAGNILLALRRKEWKVVVDGREVVVNEVRVRGISSYYALPARYAYYYTPEALLAMLSTQGYRPINQAEYQVVRKSCRFWPYRRLFNRPDMPGRPCGRRGNIGLDVLAVRESN